MKPQARPTLKPVIPGIKLSSGAEMPIIGLGTFMAKPEEVENTLDVALEAGYRHIDTAYLYENEAAIGKTLQKWMNSGKIKREELFIVTKLPMIGNRAKDVMHFMEKSLEALELEYVDLYLVHCAFGMEKRSDKELFPQNQDGTFALDMKTDIISVWKAMEAEVDAGRTKAIGVSNYNTDQLKRILSVARIPPANIQVELHAYFMQKPLREFCKQHNISVTAYAPFCSPGRKEIMKERGQDPSSLPNLLNDPLVIMISQKYGKSPAQLLLRYLTQLDIIVIPKSTNPNRIQENMKIFDITISDDDMARLDELDQGRTGRSFDFGAFFKPAYDHPEYPFHPPH